MSAPTVAELIRRTAERAGLRECRAHADRDNVQRVVSGRAR